MILTRINCFAEETARDLAIPLVLVQAAEFAEWIKTQPQAWQNWTMLNRFEAKPATFCLLPNNQGNVEQVWVGVATEDPFQLSHLPFNLPSGSYYIARNTFGNLKENALADLYLGWGMGAYQFTAYKSAKRFCAQLVTPKNLFESVTRQLTAIYLVRDLINTPTEDLGPVQLAEVAKTIAKNHHASITEIIGDDLLKENYPAIHTVGRASSQAPRLIELRWGNPKAKKLTLIGKGVCFDSGGLDLKSATNMQLMKKDMGGAAHALALAQFIMAEQLPLNLHVLIPAVENAVSGNAYRPGDVIKTRKGLSVEIGNTDAEGRLVLADALTAACAYNPELIIDFATLTGAARVALGTEIPVLFANHEKTAELILNSGKQIQETLWQLPLYQPYSELIETPIADINNSGNLPYGGAITAALFLQKFVEPPISWVHFDIMAWNLTDKPGRPKGGEAMSLRSLIYFVKNYF